MSLSATDSLNIIGYYGEMELSLAEKKLRIVMAAAFYEIIQKYYAAVHTIIADKKTDERRKNILLAAAVVSLKRAYRGFSDKYYERYVNTLCHGGEPYYGIDAWRNKHALDFSVWLMKTARNEPGVAFGNSHTAAVTRTEVNAIGNLAALDAAYRRGERFKTWKTFGDGRVRPSHRAVNGTRIPIDEAFKVGGYLMMFPNDSSLGAGAEEVVNCRCVLEFDDGKRLTNGNERGIMRVGSETIGTGSGRVNTLNAETPDNSNTARLSSIFVNSNDQLSQNAKKIKPLEGYSDIIMHGSPTELLAYDNDGAELLYSAKEAAELIRNSREFCGKPIRLIACQAGALKDGIAQQLADELGVNVLAPTEIVNVDIFGNIFISDNDILFGIWNQSPSEERIKIRQTGKWVEFKPRR